MVLVRYNTIFHLLLYVWFGTILFRVNHLFSHPSVNRDVFTVDKVISFFTKESTHAGYIFRFTDSSCIQPGAIELTVIWNWASDKANACVSE